MFHGEGSYVVERYPQGKLPTNIILELIYKLTSQKRMYTQKALLVSEQGFL
jgi:hypothetical protein